MRRVGIICEYNPFHAGHAHLIAAARAAGAREVVCVMSGNFTQRGDYLCIYSYCLINLINF